MVYNQQDDILHPTVAVDWDRRSLCERRGYTDQYIWLTTIDKESDYQINGYKREFDTVYDKREFDSQWVDNYDGILCKPTGEWSNIITNHDDYYNTSCPKTFPVLNWFQCSN